MLQQKYKVSLSNYKDINYLEKVSSNISRPILLKTWDKFKYFITFLNKRTYFLEVILLRSKSKALQAFKDFKTKAKNNPSNKRIRTF